MIEHFAAASRGDFAAALAAARTDDLAFVGPRGERSRGWPLLVRIMESDLEAGVCQRPVHVTASRRFTISESELLSPPWDPTHCPPGVVWLLSTRDERVRSIRLFHPRTLP